MLMTANVLLIVTDILLIMLEVLLLKGITDEWIYIGPGI